MNDTQDIILAELRAHASSTGERLSSLEAKMTMLTGNGQKGRVAEIEDDVKELQRWRWKVLGISTGGSAVVSAVLWLLHSIR